MINEKPSTFPVRDGLLPLPSTRVSAMKIQLNLASPDPEALLARLRFGLERATERLEIEILGPGIIVHDTALLLYDELISRPVGLRIHANARTCLLDGALLLWLAADTREIRRDAWIQLSKIPSMPDLSCSWENALPEGFKPTLLIEEETPADTDLRMIAWYLSKWLPIHEIAGLRIFRDDLAEFGLIRNESAQLEFDFLPVSGVSSMPANPLQVQSCTL